MGRIHSIGLALLVTMAAAAQDTPVFRSDVRLVRLLATVKDPAGELIGSLERSTFHIWDNNVEQEISVFERSTEQPL